MLAIEDLTHDVKRVRLVLLNPGGFAFKPGQFVFLKVPEEFVRTGTPGTGRPMARSFDPTPSPLRPAGFRSSTSSSSTSGRRAARTFRLASLRPTSTPGSSPAISSTSATPPGTLYLGQDSDRPILVVAGGSGAAPFVGLLEYWFEAGMNRTRKIHFFFGVRSRRDLLLHDKFTGWAAEKENFTYTPALSSPREGDDWQGETGYIQLSVEKYVEAPSEAEAYLAGPPIMVKMVTEVLREKGIPDSRIFFDQILARE